MIGVNGRLGRGGADTTRNFVIFERSISLIFGAKYVFEFGAHCWDFLIPNITNVFPLN